MQFDFDKIAVSDRYKLLSYTIVPRPIAWVVTLSKDGRRNAAPFSFFNVCTSDPPIIMLGITASGGRQKDTARNIVETGQFVVNLVTRELMEQMNITAIEFDASVDELAAAKLEVTPSSRVAPPRIVQSPVSFECELYQAVPMESGQMIVLGKVIGAHIKDEAVRDAERCYIEPDRLDIIGRMQARYLVTRDVFDLPRLSVKEWMERGAQASE